MRDPLANVQTPWGPSQGGKVFGDGIVFYHTAGHGGIRLSADRVREINQKFKFQTFNGNRGWYEEDCDICAVVVAFPECFQELSVARAVMRVQSDSYYGHSMQAYVESSLELQTIAQRHKTAAIA